MEAYAIRVREGYPELDYVVYKGVRIEPGRPAIEPCLCQNFPHQDMHWTFAVPTTPPLPVSVVVATKLARTIVALTKAAWFVTVLAASRIPAHVAESREARLSRPMKQMLVPDYRRRVRRATAFLVYAIFITALVGRPYFLAAYHDILAHWDWAVQHGALLPGGLVLTRER